ncbi:MAG: hypothetical protein KME40_02925 [Komarekiella atlantica HA4396-MV6]|nr:hypothetical protein [Komarekiella atlantica HA4396-MV6]
MNKIFALRSSYAISSKIPAQSIPLSGVYRVGNACKLRFLSRIRSDRWSAFTSPAYFRFAVALHHGMDAANGQIAYQNPLHSCRNRFNFLWNSAGISAHFADAVPDCVYSQLLHVQYDRTLGSWRNIARAVFEASDYIRAEHDSVRTSTRGAVLDASVCRNVDVWVGAVPGANASQYAVV